MVTCHSVHLVLKKDTNCKVKTVTEGTKNETDLEKYWSTSFLLTSESNKMEISNLPTPKASMGC